MTDTKSSQSSPARAASTTAKKASSGKVLLATPWQIDRFVVGEHTVTPEPQEFEADAAEEIRAAVASMKSWKLTVDEPVDGKPEDDDKKEGGDA